MSEPNSAAPDLPEEGPLPTPEQAREHYDTDDADLAEYYAHRAAEEARTLRVREDTILRAGVWSLAVYGGLKLLESDGPF